MIAFSMKQCCSWICQLLLLILNCNRLASSTTTSTALNSSAFPFTQTAESDARCDVFVSFHKSYSLGSMPKSHEAAPVVSVPSDAGVCSLWRISKFVLISGALGGHFLPFPLRATLEYGAVGAILGVVKAHDAYNDIIAHIERRSWLFCRSFLCPNTPRAHLVLIFCSVFLLGLYYLCSDIRGISCFLTSRILALSFFFNKDKYGFCATMSSFGCAQFAESFSHILSPNLSRHAPIWCAYSRFTLGVTSHNSSNGKCFYYFCANSWFGVDLRFRQCENWLRVLRFLRMSLFSVGLAPSDAQAGLYSLLTLLLYSARVSMNWTDSRELCPFGKVLF